MQTLLRFSLVLNATLLAVLVFGVWPRHAIEEAHRMAPASLETTSALPRIDPQPFRWSQIEATDYFTYLANLRGIGCPEPTIRDILTADVGAVYAARRRPIEMKLAATPRDDRATLETELSTLQHEESAVLLALLGKPQETAPFPSTHPGQSPTPFALPLVFQPVDLSTLNLSPAQLQAAADLREQFLEDIGGADHDPADPAYAQRWQASQPDNDDTLRGRLGISAWQDYQLAAGAGTAPGTPGPKSGVTLP